MDCLSVIRFRACAIVMTGALTLGCSDTQLPPTAPPLVAEAVILTGGQDVVEGGSIRLSATVRYSSGTSTEMSEGVTWVSDAEGVAQVDSTGLVTAIRAGQARIRATVKGVSGSTTFAVTAAARLVRGRVHESRPTEHIGVPNATVMVVDAGGTTETATTDRAGNFTLRLLPGIAAIRVTAHGYDGSLTSVDVIDGVPLSLPLVPTATEVRHTFDYSQDMKVKEHTFRVDVHHAGELRVDILGTWVGHSHQAASRMEVRDRHNRILTSSEGVFDSWAQPIRWPVRAGESFDVKIFSTYPNLGVGAWHGEVKHPR